MQLKKKKRAGQVRENLATFSASLLAATGSMSRLGVSAPGALTAIRPAWRAALSAKRPGMEFAPVCIRF